MLNKVIVAFVRGWAVLLGCLALSLSACVTPIQTGPQEVPALTEADLDKAAGLLAGNDLVVYRHLSAGDGKTQYSEPGLMFLRAPHQARFDERLGRLVHPDGTLSRVFLRPGIDGNSDLALLQLLPSGHVVLAIDRNNDSIIDVVAGKGSIEGRWWGATDEAWQNGIDCFWLAEQTDSFDALIDCVSPREEQPGPAITGALADKFVDDNLPLNCDDSTGGPGGSIVTSDGDDDQTPPGGNLDAVDWEERNREHVDDAQRHEREAERLLRGGSREDQVLAKLHQEAAQQAWEAAEAAESMIPLEPGTPEYDRAWWNYGGKKFDYIDAEHRIRERRRRGGTDSPIPDPVGGPGTQAQDPRCLPRTDLSSCGSDLLACVGKTQDPLRNFTEGNCWRETGPNDAPTIVCRRQEEDPDHPDGPIGPGGPDAGPVDGPSNFPTGPRTSIRFIDLTPLGAIIKGTCVRDGC